MQTPRDHSPPAVAIYSLLMQIIAVLLTAALAIPLLAAAAILVHPPLFNDMRPFLVPLAAAGLIAAAISAWMLWWRR